MEKKKRCILEPQTQPVSYVHFFVFFDAPCHAPQNSQSLTTGTKQLSLPLWALPLQRARRGGIYHYSIKKTNNNIPIILFMYGYGRRAWESCFWRPNASTSSQAPLVGIENYSRLPSGLSATQNSRSLRLNWQKGTKKTGAMRPIWAPAKTASGRYIDFGFQVGIFGFFKKPPIREINSTSIVKLFN